MLHFLDYFKETAIFYLKSDAPSSETVLKYFQHTKNGSYSQNKYSDNKLWKFDSYLATLIVFCSEKYHNLDKKSSKKKVALDPPTDYFDLPIKMSGKTSSITWENFRLAEFFFIKFFYKIHRAILLVGLTHFLANSSGPVRVKTTCQK